MTVRQQPELSVSLLDMLRQNGFTEPAAPCGGKGTCGKCMVRMKGQAQTVKGQAQTPDNASDEDERRLLACRVVITGDCEVWLDPAEKPVVLVDPPVAPTQPPRGKSTAADGSLGVAIDMGTTTLAVYLYDLDRKQLLASLGEGNNQRIFGADVISRIQHAATKNGLQQLTDTIRTQLNQMIAALCEGERLNPHRIGKIVVVGNTVLSHIFAGLSPKSIGVAPFTPVSLFDTRLLAAECGIDSAPNAVIFLPPAISGFVGSDITAGIYATGAYKKDAVSLFVDIGTNGEMALGNQYGFTCCATAAGPAFEGAEISCGMAASAGAIHTVTLANGMLQCETIENAKAVGICGTGLVDCIAMLLKKGVIDETGKLLTGQTIHKQPAFFINDRVYITNTDIRKVQLAKAAIAGGMVALTAAAYMDMEEIDTVYIAGGFGNDLHLENAAAIGLIPAALLEKVKCVGNTAGIGAGMALCNPEADASFRRIQKLCRAVELADGEQFAKAYINAMDFVK